MTDIVGVIDGIAYQTNILALNATARVAEVSTAAKAMEEQAMGLESVVKRFKV